MLMNVLSCCLLPSLLHLLCVCRAIRLQHVVDNPMNYEDFRGPKAAGEINSRHPDFKSMDGSMAVWVGDMATLDDGLRAALANLPANMPIGSPKARYKRKWEALLADPGAYEDLRVYKAAVPARGTLPDFRVAGAAGREQALWLDHSNSETEAFLNRLDMCAVQPRVVEPEA